MAKLAIVLFSLGLLQLGVQGGWHEQLHHIQWQYHGLPPPPPPRERAAQPEWGSIPMRLDNFDSSNTQSWTMRYISNGQHFQAGGPIFIMIGAEWTIDPGWLQGGLMYDLASENKAYMFYTEHRYYGESKPTPDLSTENLKYLTTPQALADLAIFIQWVKYTNPDLANSKVIVFGGSYGGTMATWMRLKYPDLVDGAVASSAPLLAKSDFFEYEEVVAKSLETADPGCTDVLQKAFKKIKDVLFSGPAGENQIKQDFRLCYPVDMNNPNDISYTFYGLAVTFSGLVQYASGSILKDTCDNLRSRSGDEYEKFKQFMADQRPSCIGNYKNFVDYFKQSNLPGDSRQWIWQTCNEYGFFQTSNSSKQPFGNDFPVSMNYQMCKDIFGPQFTPEYIESRIKATNDNFGGLNPQMTRVISVHGGVDPWHAIGLDHSLNNETPVHIVPTTSHCADLSGESPYETQEMQDAHKAEKECVKNWIQ